MKNCLQCDSNGGCLACAFGYVRVDGECKLLLGDGGICKVRTISKNDTLKLHHNCTHKYSLFLKEKHYLRLTWNVNMVIVSHVAVVVKVTCTRTSWGMSS